MKKFLILMFVVFLGGCVTPQLPWHVREFVSEFDGKKIITVGPVWVSYNLGFTLVNGSEELGNKVILSTQYKGTATFKDGENLLIKIDGELKALKSFSKSTKIRTEPGFSNQYLYLPPYNVSSQGYFIEKEYLKEIITSKKALFRLELTDGIADGTLDFNEGTTRQAFKDFLNRISQP